MLVCYTIYDNSDDRLIRKVPRMPLEEWYGAAQLAGGKLTTDPNLGINKMTVTWYSGEGLIVSRAEGIFEEGQRSFLMYTWDEDNPPVNWLRK